jgi:nitrogen fixation protein NifU and related proteins
VSDDLYHERILEHARHPHGAGVPAETDRRVSLDNPFCGDAVTVGVRVDEAGRVAAIGFDVEGCAVCKASASMMTAAVTGRSGSEIDTLYGRFEALLAGAAPDEAALGELVTLAGVARFPVRRRCATLAWEALRAALAGDVVR